MLEVGFKTRGDTGTPQSHDNDRNDNEIPKHFVWGLKIMGKRQKHCCSAQFILHHLRPNSDQRQTSPVKL